MEDILRILGIGVEGYGKYEETQILKSNFERFFKLATIFVVMYFLTKMIIAR